MRTVHLLLLIAATTVATSPAVASMKGAALARQAKVFLETARRTALAARPGNITDKELEKEKGGSGLRYSFDIASRGRNYEVGVDAKTGVVLENGIETKAD